MKSKNLIRYADMKNSEVIYGGIPAKVVENSYSYKQTGQPIGCAYIVNWGFEYVDGMKYLTITYNVEDEFMFDKLYMLNGEVNHELLDLLEETESIRLCDGAIDFDRILMRNVNFISRLDQKTGLYLIENLYPVDDSYGENLGAFFDTEEIFKELAKPTEKNA